MCEECDDDKHACVKMLRLNNKLYKETAFIAFSK